MKSYLFVVLLCFGLSACIAPSVQSTSTPTITNTPAFTSTAIIEATATIPSSPEPPVAFPDQFESDVLRPEIEPVTYIADSCTYLERRWDPQGALPGTVVAPIMFHSILEGNTTPTDSSAINFEQFEGIVRQAERLGFETITMEELLAFLKENAKIPKRSMILILDDRKPGTAEDYFLPVNEEHDWTTTLAWIADSDTDQRPGRRAGETLWGWIERINDTGYFDVQSHGKDHIYINEDMSEETIRTEIEGSIPFLEAHFGQTPIAYIWPGGNFTEFGIQVAHEAGFELGFTIFSRGPVQFNWIPQGHEFAFEDPLMLLPRFWSSAAVFNLEQTAQVGDAAQAFARDNYPAEAAWFRQNCGGELPLLDEVFK
jgi:peptidoglycan/xylan/chitin deacetylase (PgdA/CDA1 family)